MRETDSLIDRYCNTTAPDNVIVEGNELYIKFSSDKGLQHNGFMITWSAVQAGKMLCFVCKELAIFLTLLEPYCNLTEMKVVYKKVFLFSVPYQMR